MVNRESGYEARQTSKEQTRCNWNVHHHAQSFVLRLKHYARINRDASIG